MSRAVGRFFPWPLPALLAWAACWGLFAAVRAVDGPVLAALLAGAATGALLSPVGGSRWRRLIVALGFPCSLAASGAGAALPAWAWLAPLVALATLYPVTAWRDAPVFPTPAGALDGLPALVPLGAGARVLDAGCGLGDGLRALRRGYPRARLDGLEWSWPLRWIAALRCRDADIRRGDIWAADWSGYQMVYFFQRPESMAKAHEKARRELPAGAWLVSLEFAVPNRTPSAAIELGQGRRLWLYQMPGR